MKYPTETADNEAQEKVWEMIKDIKIAMMGTQGLDGHLYARPMANQKRDEDGNLWFFTSADTAKVEEIAHYPNVVLSYADNGGDTYVSVAGAAAVIRDQAKIDELWTDFLKAWFPEGKDDPNVTLIRVEPFSAEYWDNPSSSFVQAFGYLKGKITGKPEVMGENRIVRM